MYPWLAVEGREINGGGRKVKAGKKKLRKEGRKVVEVLSVNICDDLSCKGMEGRKLDKKEENRYRK